MLPLCRLLPPRHLLIPFKYSNTNSGGWVEFQDFDLNFYSEDGTLTEDHELKKWSRALTQASRSRGNDPQPSTMMEQWLTAAGFVNIQSKKFQVPVGSWAKDKLMVGHSFHPSRQGMRS